MRVQQFKESYGSLRELTSDLKNIGNNEPTFTVTLTPNAATTVVPNIMVGVDSVIKFMPTTANAAADMNSLYVSSRGKSTFTITHANNANTDRTFVYTVFG